MNPKKDESLHPVCPLTFRQRFVKRAFDLIFALLGVLLTWWIMGIAIILATWDTKRWGLFSQVRIGLYGKPFYMYKVRSMREMANIRTHVTAAGDPRITRFGKFLRRTKIDELPQLFNILLGQMSFVGPRPDVRGFADRLQGEDRVILTVRPGIIGPGTLKYIEEEEELAKQHNPQEYNRNVIYPDKVRLNRIYVSNYSFLTDLKYLFKTLTRLRYHYR